MKSWQRAYRGQIPDDVLDALDESKRAARWLELIPQPGHVMHVAVHDGIVIGFCSLIRSRDHASSDDAGEIAAIYVDPEHWRSGVGSELLHASLDVARSTGYRELTLWVLASNLLGRRFYEQLGFASDGKTKVEERGSYSLHEIRYGRRLTPQRSTARSCDPPFYLPSRCAAAGAASSRHPLAHFTRRVAPSTQSSPLSHEQ